MGKSCHDVTLTSKFKMMSDITVIRKQAYGNSKMNILNVIGKIDQKDR